MMTAEDREEFLKIYRVYSDNKEEQEAKNLALKDLVKTFARKVELKPAIVNKALAEMYKSAQGESTLDEVVTFMVEVKEAE